MDFKPLIGSSKATFELEYPIILAPQSETHKYWKLLSKQFGSLSTLQLGLFEAWAAIYNLNRPISCWWSWHSMSLHHVTLLLLSPRFRWLRIVHFHFRMTPLPYFRVMYIRRFPWSDIRTTSSCAHKLLCQYFSLRLERGSVTEHLTEHIYVKMCEQLRLSGRTSNSLHYFNRLVVLLSWVSIHSYLITLDITA